MRILLAVAAVLAAGCAQAKTVTLGSSDCAWTVAEYGDSQSSNSGHNLDPYTVTGCGLQYETASSYNGPPALQLHDDAGGAVQSTIRSLSGNLFDLTGASIFAWVNTYLAGDWVDAPTEEILRGELPGYENVGLFGYRDGALVASLSYFQPSGTTGDANIGDGFKGLDTLVFKLLQPNPTKVGQLLDFGEGLFFQGAEGMPKNEVWCDAYYCGALYGQITLEVAEPSPVPLPATLPLLLTGLLLLRRRL